MRGDLEQLAADRNYEPRNLSAVAFEDMPAMYDSADIYLTATNLIYEFIVEGLSVPVVTTDAGAFLYRDP